VEVAETVVEVEAVPEIVGVAPGTVGAGAGPGIVAEEAGLGIAVVGPEIGAVAPGIVGLGIVVVVVAVVGTDSGSHPEAPGAGLGL